MSQLSVRPGPLSADAVQLIDGQYADRPHLRPILDAVLAALPVLGVLLTSAALHEPQLQSLLDAVGPAVSGALSAVTLNRLAKRKQEDSLMTEDYYLIWALQQH